MKFGASFWEAVRKYLVTQGMRDLLVSIATKLVLGSMGGFGLFIGKWLLGKVISWGWIEFQNAVAHEIIEAINSDARKDYEKTINDPNSTAEQIKDSAPDFLGGHIK